MTDRDQVAREVLTELANWNMARVETLKDATRFRDERYPAPAAPVTVTVGDWKCSVVPHARDCIVEHIQRAQLPFTSPQGAPLYECVLRIASDARRIEELEAANASLKAETDRISAMRQDALDELVRVGSERDEARRQLKMQLEYSIQLQRLIEWLDRGGMEGDDALVERDLCEHHAQKADRIALRLRAATSQGEGLGAPASTRDEAPNSEVTGGGIAAASPSPIPLGAAVEVENDWLGPYERTNGGWIPGPDGRRFDGILRDGTPRAEIITAHYRALHPVADRATVERVAAVFAGAMVAGFVPNDCARRVLRALGYEVAE